MKTGLGLLALLLPGGLLFLLVWVAVRALARARIRSGAGSVGESSGGWEALSHLSFRDVLREARATL
jgi:hypothetical protein